MSQKRKSDSVQDNYCPPPPTKRVSLSRHPLDISPMASSRGPQVENMFHSTHIPVMGPGSPHGSGFLHDDGIFDVPKTENAGTEMDPMFGMDTQEWVSTQSVLLPVSGSMMHPVEGSYVHDHEALNVESWPNMTEVQGAMPVWSMAPNMAHSISEFTQLTDTISNTSSPVTSASVGDFEGSCSPEAMMPPLAIAPSVFDGFSNDGTLRVMDQWSNGLAPLETAKASYGTNEMTLSPSTARPSLEQAGRRQSNDSDPQKARSDWRYSLPVGKDNLYHCPFVPCSHAPDKLKCNYDKHLDSHLKPYRCKVEACQETAFSSTACVLRHEREAHGMHGHGTKPFTCVFTDCERSNPENGFPRRWNLHDHMRRMHNYTPKTGSDESSEGHTAGPTRTKRASRTSPKPRVSKDDTIKASSAKRSSRGGMPKAWLDQPIVCQPPSNFELAYSPATIDISQLSPSGMYLHWSNMS